jgi:hypothetical protein
MTKPCVSCRYYIERSRACGPAFGANCYNSLDALLLVSQQRCVPTAEKAFNVSTPAVVQSLYELNVRAHEACAALATMVRPSATLPANVVHACNATSMHYRTCAGAQCLPAMHACGTASMHYSLSEAFPVHVHAPLALTLSAYSCAAHTVFLQEECEGAATPELQNISSTADALHSQIPYRVNSPLAQQVFQRNLLQVPQPTLAPAAAPAGAALTDQETERAVPDLPERSAQRHQL